MLLDWETLKKCSSQGANFAGAAEGDGVSDEKTSIHHATGQEEQHTVRQIGRTYFSGMFVTL